MALRLPRLRTPAGLVRRVYAAGGVWLRDLVGLAGFSAFVHGLQLVYPPAAWIVGGAIVAGVVILLSRRKATS